MRRLESNMRSVIAMKEKERRSLLIIKTRDEGRMWVPLMNKKKWRDW